MVMARTTQTQTTPKTENGYIEVLKPDKKGKLLNEYSAMGLMEQAEIGMDIIAKTKLDDNDLQTKAADLVAYILHAVYQNGATEDEALAILEQASNNFVSEIRGIY